MEAPQVNVGDRVLVLRRSGTVRYVGAVPAAAKSAGSAVASASRSAGGAGEEQWVGVELEEPLSWRDGNGSFRGHSFFETQPGCAVFIQARLIVPAGKKEMAAIALQSRFRVHLARKRVKAQQAARTWNVLDNHYEEVGLRKGKAVEKATKQLKAKTIVQEKRTQMEDAVVSSAVSSSSSSSSASSSSAGVLQQHEQQPVPMEDINIATVASKNVEEQATSIDDVHFMADEKQVEVESMSSGESSDEEEALFMGATVEELQQAAADAVEELVPEMLQAINVAESYTGPHLTFPLRLESVFEMLDAFKEEKVLHFKYFMLLLLHGKRLFEREQTVQEIEIPKGVKLTVVGDTHGQLQDLYTIFTINGVPTETNWYLFNGDFVDRGSKGCEIVAVMLAFKISYPQFVFLNRGNHEARAQNAWMGFEEELLTKYGHDVEAVSMNPSTDVLDSGRDPNTTVRHTQKKARKNSQDRATSMRHSMNIFGPGDRLASLKLYMLCQAMFDSLPLCALIQQRVYVCHGGLFRNEGVKIEHLRNINRKREPPLEGKSFEDRIYEDLLWSDPRPTATYPRPLKYKRPSDRGAGCEFGPLVTNKFCATNQIALVVRSHECVPEGYEVLHNGRLITIFSASRYCGTQTNKGAFIAFGPDLQPEIQQFYAHSIQRGNFMTDEEREEMLEKDAIKMIVENICDKRIDLYWYYTQADKDMTGRVSRVEWAQGLASVLHLEVPFLHYQTHLAELEPDGKSINYTRFLSRWQIGVRQEDAGWQDGIVQRICEKLYSIVGADLEGAYRKFDINNDGRVSFDEFVKTLRSLQLGLSDQEIFELMRIVDKDESGAIDFEEFANRFELTFSSIGQEEADEEEQRQGLANMSLDARPGRSASMRDLEERTKAEFPDAPSSPRSAHKMKLDWNAMDDWTVDRLKNIGKGIYMRTDSTREAFKKFDVQERGFFGLDEWVATLDSWLGLKMSREDAERLFRAIDTNTSDRLSAIEFVDAFQIRDKSSSAKSWQQGVVQQVANALYQNRIHLKAAFRMFDVDGNGTISVEEFQSGMETINELLDKPLSQTGIEELRRSLDRNGDGSIDYKEFLAGLHLIDSSQVPGLSRRRSSYMDLNDPMFRKKSMEPRDESATTIHEDQATSMEVDSS